MSYRWRENSDDTLKKVERKLEGTIVSENSEIPWTEVPMGLMAPNTDKQLLLLLFLSYQLPAPT
jgi:hypothetical protein